MHKMEFIKQLGDVGFQKSLLANPHEALRKVGMELPATTEIKVVSNSEGVANFVFPAGSAEVATLSDDELAHISSAGEIFTSVILAVVAAVSIATILGTTAAVGLTLENELGSHT